MNLILKTIAAIFLSFYSAISFSASGLFTDKLDGQFDMSRYLSDNAYGFLPVPIIITDPAVEGGLGMMGLFFHESEQEKNARLDSMQDEENENAAQSLMPPSISAAFGAYTGNDSYFAGGGYLGFFNKGTIRYLGGGGYGDVNVDYYGTGNVTLAKPILLTTKAFAVMQVLKFKLGDSDFFVGPIQRYVNADISAGDFDNLTGQIPDKIEDNLRSLLSTNIVTSGAGLTVEYDSRNNFFSPTTGLNYALNYLWFDDAIGSDIDYSLIEFTALNYFKFNERWRTAFRVEVDYVNSDGFIPPYATPYVSLRGIPSARYQGPAVAITELELAYRIDLRWELSVFTGVGKASDSFSDFSDAESLVNRGVGFRYLIARRYDFNMGLDVAKGPEETVVYIQAGSAW